MQEEPELEGLVVQYFQSLIERPQHLTSFEQLSTGLALAEVLAQVEGLDIDYQRVTAGGWSTSLNNLKLLMRELQAFYQSHLTQSINRQDVDLLKIAKFQERDQLMKLVRIVIAVLTQANNKHHFIGKILELQPEQQHLMAQLIQSALSMETQPRECASPDGLVKQKHDLLHKLNELEQQVASLTAELGEVRQQRDQMARRLDEQTLRVEYLEEQASQLKLSSLDAKIEMISVIEKEQTNSLVENLKQKLISVSIEHQKEIIKYRQEIEMMENGASRVNELEKLSEDYLDTIKDLQGKLADFAREKEDLLKKVEDRTKALETHINTERALNQRLKQMEYDNVNLKLENQRGAIRSNQLKQTISKITAPPPSQPDNNKSYRSTSKLSDLCPQIDSTSQQNRLQQLQKEIEILNNRNKELERELSKCRLRAERCDKLEDEKRKLEQVLLDYSNSRGEEIEVLMTAMYELRIRYKNLLRKYEERQNIHSKELRVDSCTESVGGVGKA